MAKLKVKTSSPVLSNIFKGSLISVSITLVSILIFALIIKFANIPDNVIAPVNQAIKIVSIFMWVVLAFNRHTTNGFVKGFLIGVVYTVLAYLIFSILAKEFSFTLTSFTDTLFGGVIGGISGIIVANIKK